MNVASMIWQAACQFAGWLEERLLNDYIDSLSRWSTQVDRSSSKPVQWVCINTLYSAGAYGSRLFERKPIPDQQFPRPWIICNGLLMTRALAFHSRIQKSWKLCCEEIMKDLQPSRPAKKTPGGPHQSFSFKKQIRPIKAGMGVACFRFRGILNPGRIEELKQDRRDREVKDYLETSKHACPSFWYVFDMWHNVELSPSGLWKHHDQFGCTGGQHRSVYAADALAAPANKFAG